MLNLSPYIGQRIADRRKKLNLNQDELAKRIGVSKTYIRELEKGKRYPDVFRVEKRVYDLCGDCYVFDFDYWNDIGKEGYNGLRSIHELRCSCSWYRSISYPCLYRASISNWVRDSKKEHKERVRQRQHRNTDK